MQRMENLGGRAAVVGPKGSGKTTLLEEVARRLEQPAVVLRIPGSCPQPWRTVRAQLPRPVAYRHAILVDGSEQLGAFGWRRLLHATRRARYLIVTLHRPGRLPTLIECRTDAGLLRDLVSELAPRECNEIEFSLDGLFHRNNGNLRLCLRELYDVYAGRA
jgi:GTPase SAR1 family protein